jgi:hypothetical protein
MTWTSPQDLREQLQRYWSNGRLLTDPALFPLELKMRRPDSRALSERFEEVRQWIRSLEAEPAYRIEWTEVEHRVLGRNRVPRGVTVPTQGDALRLLDRVEDAMRFQALSSLTMRRLPELNAWLMRKPLVALELAADWDRILDVLLWFREHPRCGLYLRQLDIPGVGTKFIEALKPQFIELLGCVLPREDCESGPRYFERRYGLKTKPLQVRFRILDPRLAIQGLTDLAIPTSDLAALELPVARVFITENEINGLAFPNVRDSMVIFGMGYGLELLALIRWLNTRAIHYWGDIDTYGFHMLDLLRANFPHAQSFLMDRRTLIEHRALCVTEATPYRGELTRLTAEERSLFQDLHGDRLEQERIRYRWVEETLKVVTASGLSDTPGTDRPDRACAARTPPWP